MPRIAEPRWDDRREIWYANIGAKDDKGRAREVFAPKSIGEREKDRAWEWFRDEKRRRESQAAPSDVTVEWIAEHYLAWAEAQRDEGKITVEEYANKSRHLDILCQSLGSRIAAALTPDDLTGMAEALAENYSASYVRVICATTMNAMNWAASAKRGYIPANPMRGYKAPVVPRSPVRFAEKVEAAAFVGFWRTRMPRSYERSRLDRLTLLMDRILIRTGARPKELCVLQWPDITWKGWESSAGHSCAKAVIPPDRWKTGKKTGKPRTIYFTPMLTRSLRREHGRPDRHPLYVFVHGSGMGGVGAGEPWRSGSALSKTILKVRRRMIARQEDLRRRIGSGDPTIRQGERRLAAVEIQDAGHNRLVNYRWRHTAISTLLMMGVDVPTVAELTGTSPKMIYQHYGHLLDSHLSAAAEKLVGRQAR